MLSMPNKLRAAAMELLERVRVGLDIPSRAEVLDLAARIEAISTQLSSLEANRAADSKLVEELRKDTLASKTPAPQPSASKKVRESRKQRSATVDKTAVADKGAATADAPGTGADKPKPKARAKAKPRSRKRSPVDK